MTELLSPARRNYMLGLLVVLYALNFIDRQILAILVEPIKAELGFSDTALGFLTGFAFAAFYATLGIPIAHLADRVNRVNIISFAVVLWSGMTALCGFANTFVQLTLARIGVGVGEAGLTPPTHSILSDSFPPERRGMALAVYQMGVPAGSLLGLMIGGWVAELYGWRMAFFAVGVPGVVFAVLAKLTLKEPPRGTFDEGEAEPQPPFLESFRVLWQKPSFRHICFGFGLSAFAGFGLGNWLPAFFGREHGMSTGEIANYLGPLGLVSGVSATLLGGYLGDRLGRRDRRRYLLLVAVTFMASLPFYFGILLGGSVEMAFGAYFLQSLIGGMGMAPSFAMVQALAPQRLRAMGSAIVLFFANMVGIGAGPLCVGLLSDSLAGPFGAQSLKWAMFIVVPVTAWSALHYYLASRRLLDDLGESSGPDSAISAGR